MKQKVHVKILDFEKRFGKQVVLEKINVEIKKGELLGIIGPNGGGKSTLLRAIAGLLSPSSGGILINGLSPKKVAKECPGALGLVLPTPGFYPLLSGWENLIYFGALFGIEETDVRAGSTQNIADLKLTEMSKAVGTWSSGTQQKLSLVRALLLKPELLLLDEPTANLDPLVGDLFFNTIRKLADEGTTCVLVTHRLGQAERICDRVLLVEREIRSDINIHSTDEDGKLLKRWLELEEEKSE